MQHFFMLLHCRCKCFFFVQCHSCFIVLTILVYQSGKKSQFDRKYLRIFTWQCFIVAGLPPSSGRRGSGDVFNLLSTFIYFSLPVILPRITAKIYVVFQFGPIDGVFVIINFGTSCHWDNIKNYLCLLLNYFVLTAADLLFSSFTISNQVTDMAPVAIQIINWE